jgi:hypothetical protein
VLVDISKFSAFGFDAGHAVGWAVLQSITREVIAARCDGV